MQTEIQVGNSTVFEREGLGQVNPYEMSIDLRVLNHLGLNLYSNAAAVLSEAVANAWDADATEVHVSFTEDKITIQDNGRGMDREDLNKRFLFVGYDKRKAEGDQTARGRKFMGRKGIGKLSLFSIAETVEVHSAKGNKLNAFRMNVTKISQTIEAHQSYFPEPIEPEPIQVGTKIILTNLKKKRTGHSATALRKRVARRFSIIGLKTPSDSFNVYLDGQSITHADRDDMRNVEFLWEFGEKKVPDSALPSVRKREILADVVGGRDEWRVRGWLGTVSEPKDLSNDQSGGMNNVLVLSRGRLIQENILDRINYSRILSSYLTGQIEAEFLDLTNQDDIATSDRQRMLEDDERYQNLVAFLRKTLVDIQDTWTDWRNEERGKDALVEKPVLAEWLDTLPAGQRKPAQRMLGLIGGVPLQNENERGDLFKSGIFAFERLRIREESHRLGDAKVLSAENLLPLLSDLATLEGSLYRDIVKSRVEVIRKFEGLVDVDEKEKVLQEHLFKNLWLLDPAWDRATDSERMERRLKTEFAEFSPTLTEEESKGRYDIKYKTNGGLNILVELKRAGRKMHLAELLEQGQKYFSALRKCLAVAADVPNPPIAIVFVLGQPVYEHEDPYLGEMHVTKTLSSLNARVVYYEQLIQGALAAYDEYLQRTIALDKIEAISKGV